MRLLRASVPRALSHPLDTPAEFTSLTRSLLPPQGRLLLGTFEQALGMQFEAELRVTEMKTGRKEEERGPTCLAHNTKPASGCSGSGRLGAGGSPCFPFNLTFQREHRQGHTVAVTIATTHLRRDTLSS